MPRILGVDIPANKKLVYSLRYIYGIGPTRAAAIVAESGFDADRRAGDLSEEEVNKLASIVGEKQYVVEGDLRHMRGLPVRGQRTKTNARTRKGAVKPVRR
jgi:small subunit ribosomal protein S13